MKFEVTFIYSISLYTKFSSSFFFMLLLIICLSVKF